MDVADLYLESRRRANAVDTDDWTAIEDAGMDPGDALFDTPVYDKIEKRIVGNRLQHVGIGNDDAEGEAILMEEDAPADTVPAVKPLSPIIEQIRGASQHMPSGAPTIAQIQGAAGGGEPEPAAVAPTDGQPSLTNIPRTD